MASRAFSQPAAYITTHSIARMLALAYLRDNQVDNALGSLDDALRFVEQTGERFNEAELHRLRGELLLARGRASDEEGSRVVREKRSRSHAGRTPKSWELRATISLARLLAMQGLATKRARCSPKSTAGSPRASTPPT